MKAWNRAITAVMENGRDYRMGKDRMFRQLLNVNIIIEKPEKDIDKPIRILNRSDKWLYPNIEELKGAVLTKENVHSYEYTYG